MMNKFAATNVQTLLRSKSLPLCITERPKWSYESLYCEDYPNKHSAAGRAFRENLPDPRHPWLAPSTDLMPEPTYEILMNAACGGKLPVQYRTPEASKQIMSFLTKLDSELPPRDFKFHVHQQDPDASRIRTLIESGALLTFPSDVGWWILLEQLDAHISKSVSYSDPESDWYQDQNDFTDVDELGVLLNFHSELYPDLYRDFEMTDHDFSAEIPESWGTKW